MGKNVESREVVRGQVDVVQRFRFLPLAFSDVTARDVTDARLFAAAAADDLEACLHTTTTTTATTTSADSTSFPRTDIAALASIKSTTSYGQPGFDNTVLFDSERRFLDWHPWSLFPGGIGHSNNHVEAKSRFQTSKYSLSPNSYHTLHPLDQP